MQSLHAGRWGLISAAAKTIQSGQALDHLPALLKRIIEEDAWREFVTPLGDVEHFDTFVAFAEHQWGLHTSLPTLYRLCGNDLVALDALDRVTQRKRGGDYNKKAESADAISYDEGASPLLPLPMEESNVNNVNIATKNEEQRGRRPMGNDRACALRRLRGQRPDIHARVLAKEISPHQGMIEAGFRHAPTPEETMHRVWRKMESGTRLQWIMQLLTPEERDALRMLLNQDKE